MFLIGMLSMEIQLFKRNDKKNSKKNINNNYCKLIILKYINMNILNIHFFLIKFIRY